MNEDATLLTLDIDWAPDGVIDDTADILLRYGVKATWFVTHSSPAVNRLREHSDLFELGIHPNFLSGSTQGDTPEEILRYCLDVVPEATVMRTHSLVQSSPLLNLVLKNTPITMDSSLLLPYAARVAPVTFRYNGRELRRVPYIWADDIEMEQRIPRWDRSFQEPGLKVMGFHPIHIAMNNRSMDEYRSSRDSMKVHDGEGTRGMFLRTVERLTESYCLRDYAPF